MNRLREKMTATLLIAIFMISIFTVALPVSAQTTIRVPDDYPTIQEAIDAANEGDTILVGRGEWFGGAVDKPVKIIGMPGAVINDGPQYPWPGEEPHDPSGRFGFYIWPEGSGTTISRLTFRGEPIGEDWLISAVWGRFGANDITVTHNKIYMEDYTEGERSVQCINNWDCSNWVIKHNVIINRGSYNYFFGILVGSIYEELEGFEEFGANGNIVAHNKIISEEGARERAFGISIRVQNFPYCSEVSNNKVVHNRVLVTGLDSAAIDLTVQPDEDYGWPEGSTELAKTKIHDNIIRFNNLRGSTNPIDIWPPELEEVNTISKNRQ